ncbi:hypothetical protein B0H14DRAFT_1622509 [Mycena olivaceomarginata]|nr:hypothetical protein B0H14DRAFT_1622509 [Mycena olivaceomarginata]
MAPAVAAAARLRRRRACALRSRGERYHGERPQHRRIALAPRPGREAHTSTGKVAVVYGPADFLYDVRNTVADSQLVTADGFGSCRDLLLHTEDITHACNQDTGISTVLSY